MFIEYNAKQRAYFLHCPEEYPWVHKLMDILGYEWFQVGESMGYSSWKLTSH